MGDHPKVTMWTILRDRQVFRKLFLAQVISATGNMLCVMAFAFYLLDRFSSQPAYATVAELMYSLPTLLLFFIVGVLSDRMDRQKIIQNSVLIRAVLSLGLFAALWVDQIWLIFAVLFIRAALAAFFLPAQNGLIQGVIPREQYPTAAGLNLMAFSAVGLLGNGLGASCYWLIGIEGAVIIDLMMLLISAGLIRSCTIEQEVRLPNGTTRWRDLNVRLVWEDLKEGSVYIVRHRLLFALMAGLLVLGSMNGFLTVLPLYLLKYKLEPSHYEEYTAILGAVYGIGLFAGSMIATRVVQKMKYHHMFILFLIMTALVLTACAFAVSAWMFVGLYALYAFIAPFINVPFHGWRTQITDPKMMGRVMGWFNPLVQISHSAALGFVALAFPRWISIEGMYLVLGALVGGAVLYYLLVLPPLIKKQEQTEQHQDLPLVAADRASSSS